MDRLPLVIALCVAACESPPQPAQPASRVNAVKAGEKKSAGAEEFCDKRYTAEQAPAFALPALASPAPAASGWRWVNVWATWCKPCIEEIPRLHRWRAQLGDLPLVLVSVDDSDQIVADYRKDHPEITSSARFADPAALPAWLKTLGLDEAAPIPIHVFVDAQGKTRCLRAGGVGEPDFDAVKKVLAER